MYVGGVGLVKVYKALIRLSVPLLMSMSEASSVCFHCNKVSAIQNLLSDQAWSLVPCPKAKSSSEIKNSTLLTMSHHCQSQTACLSCSSHMGNVTVDLMFPGPCLRRWLESFTPVRVDVLVTRSWLTPCDPMDCSPPCSSIHGILQVGILECVAISFSRGYLPNREIKLGCPALQADSLPSLQGTAQNIQPHHMTQQFHSWVYIAA